MDDGHVKDGLFPFGFFGNSWWRRGFLAVLAALVVADGVFWHGMLFGGRVWRIFVWFLILGGLAIGGFAFWRRDR